MGKRHLKRKQEEKFCLVRAEEALKLPLVCDKLSDFPLPAQINFLVVADVMCMTRRPASGERTDRTFLILYKYIF